MNIHTRATTIGTQTHRQTDTLSQSNALLALYAHDLGFRRLWLPVPAHPPPSREPRYKPCRADVGPRNGEDEENEEDREREDIERKRRRAREHIYLYMQLCLSARVCACVCQRVRASLSLSLCVLVCVMNMGDAYPQLAAAWACEAGVPQAQQQVPRNAARLLQVARLLRSEEDRAFECVCAGVAFL
jgi:hypothetical protein